MLSQILVILIISLAAAGLAWWMRKETGPGSSCGSSCGCCSKCDRLMQKLSEKDASAHKKQTDDGYFGQPAQMINTPTATPSSPQKRNIHGG